MCARWPTSSAISQQAVDCWQCLFQALAGNCHKSWLQLFESLDMPPMLQQPHSHSIVCKAAPPAAHIDSLSFPVASVAPHLQRPMPSRTPALSSAGKSCRISC